MRSDPVMKKIVSEYNKKRRLTSEARIKDKENRVIFKIKNPGYAKKWRENNKDHLKKWRKNWLIMNKGKHNAKCSKRRSARLNATADWADEQKIKEIYNLSSFLTLTTFGKGYHVDHIIPLQGRNVCGLHVEGNLQIMRAEDNLKKGNIHGDSSS